MDAEVEVIEANLRQPDHARDVVALTAAYACDSMGNGGPLSAEVLARLIDGLRKHPTAKVFLMYLQGEAIGIATCFVGFSTFKARPLLNIHDFAILPGERGKGLARILLAAVESKARELGCCKITLEVQENNIRARQVYERVGLSQAVYGDSTGGSLFYAKEL
jgi:GNAT superfamily N-acetyltransferase